MLADVNRNDQLLPCQVFKLAGNEAQVSADPTAVVQILVNLAEIMPASLNITMAHFVKIERNRRQRRTLFAATYQHHGMCATSHFMREKAISARHSTL